MGQTTSKPNNTPNSWRQLEVLELGSNIRGVTMPKPEGKHISPVINGITLEPISLSFV